METEVGSEAPGFKIADKIKRSKPGFHDWHTYGITVENVGDYDIHNVQVRLRFRAYPYPPCPGPRITITYPLLQEDLFYLASRNDEEDSYYTVTFTTGGSDGEEFSERLRRTFPNEKDLMKVLKEGDYDLQKLLDYFEHIQFLVRGVSGLDGTSLLEKEEYGKEDIVIF